MRYLVINQTNYGEGTYPVGTFQTRKRARYIADKLDETVGNENGDSYTVLTIESYDKFTNESIIADELQKRRHN